MENEILKIMLSKNDWYQDKSSTAKEITSHIMDFIEWLTSQSDFEKLNYNDWYENYSVNTRKTTKKLYQYWLNHIKK